LDRALRGCGERNLELRSEQGGLEYPDMKARRGQGEKGEKGSVLKIDIKFAAE